MDKSKFLSLALPFSSRLAHLDLSKSTIGKHTTLIKFLSNPIFQHLITLDLSGCQLTSLDPFLTTTIHNFPNLHTLNLSHNDKLKVSHPINPTQFPQLKVLDLRLFGDESTTLLNILPSKTLPPPQVAPISPPLVPILDDGYLDDDGSDGFIHISLDNDLNDQFTSLNDQSAASNQQPPGFDF